MSLLSSYAEESAPLTTEPTSHGDDDAVIIIESSARRRRDSTFHKNNTAKESRRNHNFFFSSFTQKKQPTIDDYNNNDNSSDNSSDGIAGCTEYRHANPLRAGKYQGYCTLQDSGGGGRVSMHDDWDFSPRNSADCDDDDDDGQFVSYWGQSYDANDDDDSANNSDSDLVETTIRPIPLRYRQYQGGMGNNSFSSTNKDAIENNNNSKNFGNNDRNRRGEGILLSLPIIRPFLRRSHQGFSDQANEFHSNNEVDDDNDDIHDDDDCNNAPSKADRNAMIKSISDGIKGTQSNEPILLNSTTSLDNSKDLQRSIQRTPPNLLNRIFLTRFIQVPHHNQEALLLRQLHDLLRKEDWSLATQLIESKPTLASKWHSVKRLYGGKFDAEVLPIHSACALCPPASFIQTLATIYPECLLMKEKAFGRTPLHIACRSLADSSVIKVLCEMEPRCVMERDGLKRVALHYLIKNYNTFGQDDDNGEEDDEDTNDESLNQSSTNRVDTDKTSDGIVALKLLLDTNIDCVKIADHRGWIPLHVACSCSARQGMIRVMNIIIDCWPESVNAKTEKHSDVFACVDMAGKHHATKDKVVTLLKEARYALESCEDKGENEVCSSASASIEASSQHSLAQGQDDDAETVKKEVEKEVANIS
eukprot:scaffold8763_cov133-Skeletonema_menzelii.AAC.3